MRNLIIVAGVAAALTLTACSSGMETSPDAIEPAPSVTQTSTEPQPEPTESTEASDPVTDPVQEPEPAGYTRDNSSAKKATLGAGKHKVPKKLQPGRYVITPSSKGSSGNLFIHTESGDSFVNEILGSSIGVPSVTVDIADGMEIELSGVKAVFTPAKTKLATTISAGDWVVGLDVPAGDYVAKPGKGQSGNFFVYGDSGYAEVNEILGGSMGVEDVSLTLTDGQIVFVSGISKVTFTEE